MRKAFLITIAVTGLMCITGVLCIYASGQFMSNGNLPTVAFPNDNPQTDAKVRLGRQLYFDKRLSSDGTISCASCHRPDAGWADVTSFSEGVSHKKGGRNAPSIINSAYTIPQFWDGRAIRLEKQAVGPVQNPVEMDLTMADMEARLSAIPGYVEQFAKVFESKPIETNVAKAIASFERTIICDDTPYDRYIAGNKSAMSAEEIRGMNLFNGKGHCTSCHSGPNFTDSRFHNLGVGYADGKFADPGRHNVTNDSKDMGAFLTQRLRCIAQTPPYLHDGSEKTLMDVVEFYNRGGVPNPNLDRLMVPLNLTEREKSDMVAFLEALSGPFPTDKEPLLPNPELTVDKLPKLLGGGK